MLVNVARHPHAQSGFRFLPAWIVSAAAALRFACAKATAIGFDNGQIRKITDFHRQLLLRVKFGPLLLLFAQVTANIVDHSVDVPRTDFDFRELLQNHGRSRERLRLHSGRDDLIARQRAEGSVIEAGDAPHREKNSADIVGSRISVR